MKRTILFLILMNAAVFAQMDKEFAIKSSDKYYWGQAEAGDPEKAKIAATRDLTSKIVSYLNSSFQEYKSDNTDDTTTRFTGSVSSSVKSKTLLKLKNLKYLDVEPTEQKFRVVAYILKDDFKEAVNDIKTEVREIFKSSEQIEKEDGIIKAVPNYYLAYLKTYYSPDPINCFSALGQDSIYSLQNYLEVKLLKFLGDIDISPEPAAVSPDVENQFDVELKASFKNKPVDNIQACFDVPDNPGRKVNNGRARLFMYNEPSSLKEKATVVLRMFTDKKGELSELNRDYRLEYKKETELDFSKVISIDFSFEDNGGGVVAFQPVIKHLSVRKTEWDFGDSTFSEENAPRHLYRKPASRTVKLKLNSSEEMVKTRMVCYNTSENKYVPEIRQQEAVKKEIPEIKPVTEEVIAKLILKNKFIELQGQLIEFKENGKLMFGMEEDFDNPEDCYLIIIDPVTQSTVAVFDKENNGRKNLIDNIVCSDVKKSYPGKSAIYVEVY